MSLKKLTQANIKNKRVLLRVDFNVLDKEGRIESDFRLRATLPTINYLIKNKASQIIIAAHAGRPEGKVVPPLSLKKIAVSLSKLLKRKVYLAPDSIGPKVIQFLRERKPGDIILLENLRFHKEEETNSSKFAKSLAAYADLYINDAFGVCHRANASVVAITKYLLSYTGLLLSKEIEALTKVRDNPMQPLVVMIGGAKASDKIPVVKNLVKKAHRVILAGAAANTFLKAHHFNIFESLYEPDQIKNAHRLLHQNMAKIILPMDVVVARPLDIDRTGRKGFDKQSIRETQVGDVHPGEAILDIGNYTYKTYAGHIQQAKTIFWAGPVGNTDYPEYSKGTFEIAKSLAKSKAYTVVGGGETIATLEKFGLLGKISHASTGGGASLEFLSGKELPGIKALERYR